MIKGLQAEGLVATPKHFAVYSVPVGGRDAGTRTDPHVAPREMRTLYLEPFRKAFCEAGALGVMSSYNDYDGEPITGSYHFLTEILRHEWGFKGYVVSDSEAVEFLYSKHKVAADAVDGAAQVINAGLNVRTNFSLPENFIYPLRHAISEGKISMQTIDSRVADVLRVKFMMGLFDNPYKGDTKKLEKVVHCKEHQNVSMRAALESIVLLKNENNILPLSKSIKKVAVIGPNAAEVDNLICRYLRVRMGMNGREGKDAAGIAYGSDMIFDHMSVTWGRDECFSINGDPKKPADLPRNITIQNSFIGQG